MVPSRSNTMRNDVKVLVLILIMSVILRDTKGAWVLWTTEQTTVSGFVPNDGLVSNGVNVKKASAVVKS